MSIIWNKYNTYLLDHRDFISNIYKNVDDGNLQKHKVVSWTITDKLFSIKSNVVKNCKAQKRTLECDEILEEASQVKQIYYKFMKNLPMEKKEYVYEKYNIIETSELRDLSKKYFESTVFDHCGLNGGNNLDRPLKCQVKNECFLIPENSKFLCGCVKEQCKKLIGNKYDIVIADPPWWNKYIRRLKKANDKLSYSMMYNEDIASVPVKDLLSENSIVAVWCTNAPSNISAVKNEIFPLWGVQYVTTWYWLKVTIDLEPLCDFSGGNGKQPYERIIIGKIGDVSVPEDCLVVSVPSALHSHKPPLLDLLTPHINVKKPNILELFARYLLPNTTSVGYEPLKWQHISLYEDTELKSEIK